MEYTFYEMVLLFFTYSFLAWMGETAVATLKEKDFKNRGFVSGPFCFVYGFTGVLMTVFLQDLQTDTIFLFLGCMIVATAVEWYTGKLLARMKQKKWWDYSDKKWNFDGYICLQYSLLWGLIGFFAVRYGNGLVLGLYELLPESVTKIAVWVLLTYGCMDMAGSVISVYHMEEKLPGLLRWNRTLQKWTYRLTAGLSGHVEERFVRSYPSMLQKQEDEAEEEKCSLVQLFWLFLIGAFLGDLVETVFCRLTAGVWMSRSSLVWGPFSVVWGLAIALATALLYKDRDKQDRSIFWTGVFLGGAYEYICSVFTELCFGKVFWDYSDIPFNLGGRINLLYCFFWGIAAVVWIKTLYPHIARWIALLLSKTGWMLTGAAVLFLAVNLCISVLALVRYDTRADGKRAESKWERSMDANFDDERMERIYPNAIAADES